jgi:hypothetical protein
MSHVDELLAAFGHVAAERESLREADGDLVPISAINLARPEIDCVADRARRRPVETAMKEHVRAIGWRMFHEGGSRLMGRVCDEVYDANGRAGSFVEHAWDGIGGVWWA